jgi:Xaa-Pro aminopeptidase
LTDTLIDRPAPSVADIERWLEADRVARPLRLEGLRARMAEEKVGAYFGVRRENIRYLTGFELGEGEEKVAGYSGQFLVSADEVVILADSRYTVQARDQAPESRLERVYNDLFSRWSELLASRRGRFRQPRDVGQARRGRAFRGAHSGRWLGGDAAPGQGRRRARACRGRVCRR